MSRSTSALGPLTTSVSDAAAPVEITILSIAAGGAGVGRLPDGKAVFVHRTAPGDRVVVRIREERNRWARAELIELVEPGLGRRAPPCPLYERCGGCALQHLDYGTQLEAKRRVVQDALGRIGGLTVEVPRLTRSPDEERYRNRVTFTLLRVSQDRVVAGFHRLERPGRIHDVDGRCLLPEPALARVWEALRRGWGSGARRLPGGKRIRLTLRSNGERVELLVRDSTGSGDAGALMKHVQGLDAVWREDKGRWRLLAGEPPPPHEWLGEEIDLGPGIFVQVNRTVAGLLHEAVMREVGTPAGRVVIDAYSGVAPYGRALAGGGALVTALELDAVAVRAARRNAPEGLTVLQGLVEERLEAALPADAVILNPPRSGLSEAVPQVLNAAPPPLVVYVSCDPATLARDLERLEAAYRVTRVQAFDLFPQTAHVETLITLNAKAGEV